MIDHLFESAVVPHGKFFISRGKKFFFKAIRLETSDEPLDFSAKLSLRTRLGELKAGRTTAIVTRGGPNAEAVLDIAGQLGLAAFVELTLPGEGLLKHSVLREACARLKPTVRILQGHRALAGYLLDVGVGVQWLKHQGVKRVQKKLCKVINRIKQLDSRAMVAINHRPETRALALLEEDLIYSSVPPLTPFELKKYIVGLHNIAESRPVVIEFEAPTPEQDERVASAFASRAAGVVANPITNQVAPDLLHIRKLTSGELLPFVTLNGTCPPAPRETPLVSVVVCAYNAERTMRRCLESLRTLDYANHEVIIVDDGSRDSTAEISMDFPEFRLIRQSNKGLSVARNVGMHAARGEYIAYTDSDCVVDPHWLTLIIRSIVENNFDGCGGPNYAPHEDGWIEASCAASPGAPCHVLVAEDRAEHLAGCNLVFAKSALAKIGGFDAQFRTAGDDVDICWRMLEAGYKLGFSPAAFVWHFRRNTVSAYYGQQRGYGNAEAMLYPKYPERFNIMGQIAWRGIIPGLARTIPGGNRKRVLWNAAARAQSLFDPGLTLARVLPQTLEWTVLSAVALVASVVLGVSLIPAAAMLALGPIWALYYAFHAPLEKSHDSFTARLLIAYLAYTGPMVRTMTRYKTRAKALTGLAKADGVRQRPSVNWLRRTVRLDYWNDESITRDRLIDRMLKLFA